MKKLIAVLGVVVMLGMVAACSCPGPQPMSYKGETR
jgi:hypothetical protein